MYVYCSDCDQQIDEDLLEIDFTTNEYRCPKCGNPDLHILSSKGDCDYD